MGNYFAIENLKVNYKTFEGEKQVLDLEHLALDKGETFGLVGESGAGKTVLALTILRLLATPPGVIAGGQIIFDGEDLLGKSQKEMGKIRGRRMSMIFQDPMSTLNPVFTVGEQIIRVIQHNKKVSRKTATQDALTLIERVDLPDAANIMSKYAHELSGGQRQRIIIAMALSCGAEFLIADEPTRNLDVTIQAGILKLIAQLQKELNVTVLFIANNLGLVSVTCDRVGILYQGMIVEIGTVKEVLKTPLHPYTHTLLNAVPRSKQAKIDLSQVGLMGELTESVAGCRYYGRCLRKVERCRVDAPLLTAVDGTHLVACHRLHEGVV